MISASAIVHFITLFFANMIVWSFVEWWVHRTIMHRRSLPGFIYRMVPYFEAAFRNHAVLHHAVYYKTYDHEPDPHGRLLNLRFHVSDLVSSNLFVAPLHVVYLLTEPVGSVALASMITIYMFTWNALHLEMHIPSNRGWFHHCVFRFLNRHHYMHHVYPGRNFNVVLPLADYLLGTVARPDPAERRAMADYGLYGDWRGTEVRAAVDETGLVPR